MTAAAYRSKARSFKRAFGPIVWSDTREDDEARELRFDLLFTPEGDAMMEIEREIEERVLTGRVVRRLDNSFNEE